MGLATNYLMVAKNIGAILESIRNAQAPDKFTVTFLENLGFKSTNDRAVIGVLKSLGFLDDSGAPKQRYFEYLDQSQSGKVLAEGIQEAYADLFRVNAKANELSQQEVKNKLRTLTQGAKGDAVLDKMASTFAALCKLADFKSVRTSESKLPSPSAADVPPVGAAESRVHHGKGMSLVYNINVVLPATRDQAVYDVLFRSLRDHLL